MASCTRRPPCIGSILLRRFCAQAVALDAGISLVAASMEGPAAVWMNIGMYQKRIDVALRLGRVALAMEYRRELEELAEGM
jgi:hypothetical protein